MRREPEVFQQFTSNFEREWRRAVLFLPAYADKSEYIRNIIRQRAELEIRDINSKYKMERTRERVIKLLREKDAWGVVDELLL